MIRAALAVAAFLLASSIAVPAPAVDALRFEEIERAEALAASLAAASGGDAVRIAAAEGGLATARVEVPLLAAVDALVAMRERAEGPLTPTQIAETRAALANLPSGLEAPLARVLSAFVVAQDLHERALSALAAEEREELLRALAAPAVVSIPAPTGADFEETLVPATADAVDDPYVRGLAARVDVALLAEAAAILADAAQAALPALREVAASLPWTLSAPSPIDFPPYLGIDGPGSAVWTSDYYVAIDLAGSDTWNNNAGAGALGLTVPVALAIDVLGNDNYVQSVGGLSSATVVTQGAGRLGVGVLVDAEGTDTYTATAILTPPPLTDPAPSALVVAQGAGMLGAGVLVDLVGGNTFTAATSTLGGVATTVAQGAGSGPGVGVLTGGVDLPQSPISGGTVSSYSASSLSDILLVAQTANSRISSFGPALTVAQGAAGSFPLLAGGPLYVGGAGALVDLAGSESYVATSDGVLGVTAAQGGGLGGAGLLVDAEGADAMSAFATSSPSMVAALPVTCPSGFICGFIGTVTIMALDALTVAQGAGQLGLGVLADGGLGGSHTATAVTAPVGSVSITWAGGGGSPGLLRAETFVTGGSANVRAQGSGELGVGVVLGSLGGDLHRIVATTSATATATSTGGAPSQAVAQAFAGNPNGAGHGAATTGAGAIVDPLGSDTYQVIESSTATATQNGGPGLAVAGTPVFHGRGRAIGSGLGLFLDLAGAGDVHSAVPGPTPGPGTPGTCWTNSPPGFPTDTNFGVGISVIGTSPLTPPCFPPPPPN